MTQTLLPKSDRAHAAIEKAEANYESNLAGLQSLKQRIVPQLAYTALDVEWIFARDGSLTAMEEGERWWGGCSLPRRAGQFMLKSMEISGVVACFLNPIHAAHLRAALDLLEPQQAIVAIVPDTQTLWVMLHCEDLSADFRSHRLWFVTGERWEEDLAILFVENPGLPTPSQFIRAISADNSPADRLIGPAQRIFADESTRRGSQAQLIASEWNRTRISAKRFCVVAPSRFRLWNDAPLVLAGIMRDAAAEGLDFCQFDPDDPSSASPLALALLLADCDAAVTANLSRVDLPGIVPKEMPLITWVTLPRIPPYELSGPRDRLLVADTDWREQALLLGWPNEKVLVASWPAISSRSAEAGPVSLIADTSPLNPPKQVTDYSSHRLLWEMIQNELPRDPFLIGDSAETYLKQRMARLRIAEEGFSGPFFIERLIVPAYQQGLARLLLDRNVSLQLFGWGWDQIEEFQSKARGPVESREQFGEIVAGSSALVHAWPFAHAHPIDAAVRPVLRAFARTREAFLREPIPRPLNYTSLSARVIFSAV